MIVLSVVNFKGGSGKTTSAAWMLHALAESDVNVFGIDADPQGSLSKWAQRASWSVPVAHLASPSLHRRVRGVAGDRDVVVIDSPPLELQRGIVLSAAEAATHVLVPVGASPVEYEELGVCQALVREVGPPAAAVMLTRIKGGTTSHIGMREQMGEDGWRVLSSQVPDLERFRQSYSQPINRAAETAYADAAAEFLMGADQ